MARPTGITTRHSRRCRSRSGGGCNCDPSYEAWVWSQRDGRKIRKTFAGKGALSAAKGWRHDPGSAVRKGTMQAPTRQTLTEAAETWLEGAKGGAILTRSGRPHKPAVIRGYEADLRRYVLPDLGAHRLAVLRRSDLQALVEPTRQGRSLGLEDSQRRHAGTHALPARDRARRDPHQPDDEPAAACRERTTRARRLAAGGGRVDRGATGGQRCLWWTAALAGLRRGELRALRWSDVDLGENVIAVSRSWDEKEGPVAPKSRKGTRRIPIPASLRKHLLAEDAHRARWGGPRLRRCG